MNFMQIKTMLYVALRYETICQTVKKCENWKGKIKQQQQSVIRCMKTAS